MAIPWRIVFVLKRTDQKIDRHHTDPSRGPQRLLNRHRVVRLLLGTALMTMKAHDLSETASSEMNNLIDRLPWREYAMIMAHCEEVELTLGQVLCEEKMPFQYVYFPITGVISLVKVLNGHQSLEVEQIGNEGILGASLILGVNIAPHRGIVQACGIALRMNSEKLLEILSNCPATSRILDRYLYLTIVQLTQTAACFRFHDVPERLARALLMAHDRAHSNQFNLTHQFLADMLGVQRGGITIAASHLQRKNIIRYSRGNISILDRKALEAESCECYSLIINCYARLFS